MKILIVAALTSLMIILPSIGIRLEKKGFNNGICPYCKRKLVHFDTDSQGGRGYTCKNTNCGYYTWVSYKCVDKNFR
jgi:hypothetical protein